LKFPQLSHFEQAKLKAGGVTDRMDGQMDRAQRFVHNNTKLMDDKPMSMIFKCRTFTKLQ